MGARDIVIRSATIEDAAGIARVNVGSWRFAYRDLLPQAFLDGLSIEARTRFWQHGIANPLPRAVTLVAVRDSRIVGFCSCGPSLSANAPDTTGEVAAIYVDPASARQGIGRQLMDAAVGHLARQGFTDANLWVLGDNDIGKRFYERYGWTLSGTTKLDTIGATAVTELQYHLRLPNDAT